MTETTDDMTVSCAHCGEDVPIEEISDHHIEEHPNKRFDPVWYRGQETSDPSDAAHPLGSDEASPGSAVNYAQPSDPSDRIRAGNRTKFEIRGHPVTVNEWHAVLLGLGTGLATALLWLLGREEAALGLGGILLGYSILGRPFLRSLPHSSSEYPQTMATRTIRYEPWWFSITYLAIALGVIELAG